MQPLVYTLTRAAYTAKDTDHALALVAQSCAQEHSLGVLTGSLAAKWVWVQATPACKAASSGCSVLRAGIWAVQCSPG